MNGRSVADLNFRSNAVGFLRLFFASVVVWSHSFDLGGFGADPLARATHGTLTCGILAVGGFFVLSGFLITSSFEKVGNVWRYLWHRIVRIFPAFWVCLVVVAFVVAPFAFARENGSLSGFYARTQPWSYLTANATLAMHQYGVGGLLSGLPFPLVFNGSLWSLDPEFKCYLAIALLGITGVFRRLPGLMVILAALLFAFYASAWWVLASPKTTGSLDRWGLLAYFALGSCAYLFRGHIPIRKWIAALAAVALAGTVLTRAQAAVVPLSLSYLTLYAAMTLPIRNIERKADVSYGVYIYAFPVQQTLTLCGVAALGFVPYFGIAAVVTATLAACSWFAIERPALSLKNLAIQPGMLAIKLNKEIHPTRRAVPSTKDSSSV